MTCVKKLAALQKNFQEWLLRNKTLSLFKSPTSGILSSPEESEAAFRMRLRQEGREARDAALDKLRTKYQGQIERLQKQRDSAYDKLHRDQAQARAAQLSATTAFASTIASTFLGGKKFSPTAIGRAGTAARSAQKTTQKGQSVAMSQNKLAELEAKLAQLQQEAAREIENMQSDRDASNEALETVEIPPKKTNITVRLLTVGWLPFSMVAEDQLRPAWPQGV